VDVHVTDNWSNDGTYEFLLEIVKMFPERVFLSRYPEKPAQQYEWAALLDNTVRIGLESEYKWIMHCDADEIRESPWKGVSLIDAVSFVDECEYNAIDFTVLDFRPTCLYEHNNVDSAEECLRFFEFGERLGHFSQVKMWKNDKSKLYNLSNSGGHAIEFYDKKVFPLKFLLKHYPIRSQSQGMKKVFEDRLPRFTKEKRERGWHTQYDKVAESAAFIWNPNQLHVWNEWSVRAEYMVEFLSGINIVKRYRKE
jgi:hypothetical protein